MTSFSLKIFAVIAMTLDHIGKIIGQSGLLSLFPTLSKFASSQVIHYLDWIGRIAFPLLAFMIAEGAFNTRNMPKYIGRLTLLAIISEPVYYYAFSPFDPTFNNLLHSLSNLNLTNVFFTHVLGALTIYVYQSLAYKTGKMKLLLFIPFFMVAAIFAEYVNSDYGALGVILIVVLFLANNTSHRILAVVLWSFTLYIFG